MRVAAWREKSLDMASGVFVSTYCRPALRPSPSDLRRPAVPPRVDRCRASPPPTARSRPRIRSAPADRASARRPWRASGAEIDKHRPGAGRAPEPAGRDRRPDRPGQAGARARGLVAGPRGGGARQASWPRAEGPLPAETLRLIFRELMSGSRRCSGCSGSPASGPKYSYSHLAAVAKFGAGGRVRPGRHDRRGLRGGQPPPRPVRRRAAGELDRRPDRRHARHVRPAAAAQDPRRGPAAGPSLPAGQLRVGAGPAGLLQGRRRCRSAGTGWARTCRRRRCIEVVSHGGRRRAGPARGVRRRRRQPAGGVAVRAQRPGREHRGLAAQRDPVRRHRRAGRAARPATTRRR